MDVRRGLVHMNDRIEHPQMWVPFLKCLGKLFESCRSPFSLRRLAAAVVLVADLEDDLMEKPLLLALFNVPIVVRDLISRLCFLCVILRKGFIEKLMVDLFQIFPAQRNVLLGSGRIYILGNELAVIMPHASGSHHTGYFDCHTRTSCPVYYTIDFR